MMHQSSKYIKSTVKSLIPGFALNLYRTKRDNSNLRKVGIEPTSSVGMRYLGTNYGGYSIPAKSLGAGATCYCIGAGLDISFEELLAIECDADVFIFDPTPDSIDYCRARISELNVGREENLKLNIYPYGVWNEDTEMKMYVPSDPNHISHSILNMQNTEEYFVAVCKTPKTIAKELSHQKIDLVKLNVEGAEYAILDSFLDSKIYPGLICIALDELHHELDDGANDRIRSLVQKLKSAGYRLISAETVKLTFQYSATPYVDC